MHGLLAVHQRRAVRGPEQRHLHHQPHQPAHAAVRAPGTGDLRHGEGWAGSGGAGVPSNLYCKKRYTNKMRVSQSRFTKGPGQRPAQSKPRATVARKLLSLTGRNLEQNQASEEEPICFWLALGKFNGFSGSVYKKTPPLKPLRLASLLRE